MVTADDTLLCNMTFPSPDQALTAGREIIGRFAADDRFGPAAAKDVAIEHGGQPRGRGLRGMRWR